MALKYTHMGAEDYVCWDDFLQQYPDRFDRFDYDVSVGEGLIPAESVHTVEERRMRELTMKRIDVVAWKGDSPTIIEVKPNAKTPVIGQVMAYRRLYQEKFSLAFPPLAAIVCYSIDPDVEHVAQNEGIEVIQVKKLPHELPPEGLIPE